MTVRFGFTAVKWPRLAPAMVVAAGMVAYANSFSNTFILDDMATVLRPHWMGSHLWPLRCVVDLSSKFNSMIGGHNVADYHLVNLLVHLAAGLLLFGIVRRTLLLPSLKISDAGAAPWLAAVCASLWVAHPLQTESVTYICQRYESVMGMFYLLTLYGFIRATEGPHPRLWQAVSIAGCALGMASKENMITAPLMVLLYDYVFLSAAGSHGIRERWRVHAALMGTWAVLAGLTALRVQANLGAGVPTLSPISPMDYLFTQFGVMVHYLRLSVLPYGLCLDYLWPPAERWTEILPPALLIAVLVVATVWAAKGRAPAGYAGAWFFVILAPTSSIIPMGDMAFEHRMYLSLAAPVCLVVVGGYRAIRALGLPGGAWVAGGAGAVLLVGAIGLTISRNADYRSEIGMWQDVVATRPANCRAQVALAAAFLRERKYGESEAAYRRVLETVDCLDRNQGGGYRLSPMMARYYRQAGLNGLGQALIGERRLDEAARSFQKAIEAGGGAVSVYHLAQTLLLLGRNEEALRTCESALTRRPELGPAHVLRGLLLEQAKRYGEAATSYRKALQLLPGDMAASCRLAWLLATCPEEAIRDGAEAARLARAVCRETGGFNGRTFDILAAACAEVGDFREAVRIQEKAVRMASAALEQEQADGRPGSESAAEYLVGGVPLQDMKRRLDLYGEGKPYRDER